jgi:hemolysin activation/secretion protein
VGGSWLLRGYPRFSLSGTHAWVGNAEYRFPLANFVTFGFPFGPVRFPQLQGAMFSDLGQAWYRGGAPDRVLGSAGVSLRMALVPGFVLRLDTGRRFSLVTSRGSDPEDDAFYRRRFVDFFFGYNY